ncbi:MAG: LD-carboxypeptidase [Vampirovibrionales bacterium]
MMLSLNHSHSVSSLTFGIVSPASASAPETLDAGLEVLLELGYQSKFFPYAAEPDYGGIGLAGTDAQRVSDLHAAFLDPEVDAVLCTRGGYGSMRLLPLVDWSILRENPKPLIGFSDITALHLGCLTHAPEVPCLYGPMLTSNWIHPPELAWAKETLFPVLHHYQASITPTDYSIPNAFPDDWECLRRGVTQGRLMGGNLSLLAAMAGSAYVPSFEGAILFLEDWKESLYRVDRKLNTLAQAGMLGGHLKGLILGDFSFITPEPSEGIGHWLANTLAHIASRYGDWDFPIGYGFSVGHGEVCSTFPQGVNATFNATRGTLKVTLP